MCKCIICTCYRECIIKMGSKSEVCVRMTRAMVDIVKPLPLKIG